MPGTYSDNIPRIIRAWLIQLGIGEAHPSITWPVYAEIEPGTPDNVITTYRTEGRTGARTAPDMERDVREGFQVRIRASKDEVAYPKADAVKDAMDRSSTNVIVTVGSNSYRLNTIIRTSDPISFGKLSPASYRSIYTVNGVVSLRQIAP